MSDADFQKELDELHASQAKKIQKLNSREYYQKNQVWEMNHRYSDNFTQKFKEEIKKRDDYKCVICGSSEDLTVHHIYYLKLRTDTKSCVTLCRSCNGKVNEKGKRDYWINYFQNLLHYVKENKGDE